MRISPINNVYQNYNNSFKAKPVQSMVSKIAHKTLLPTAVCAYIMSPLLEVKAQEPQEEVQYKQEFVMDKKKYTMTYVNSAEEFGENAVSDIYFTPKKSKQPELRLENVYKYVENDSSYNVTAEVTELKTGKVFNIDLPEEIGDELLDLYDGKTDLFVIPGSNTYSEINVND